MKLNKSIIMIITIVLLFSTLHFNSISVSASGGTKNVLILNSYHKGYRWSDGLCESMMNEFIAKDDCIGVFLEYMDWKRYPTQDNLDHLYERFKYKYADKSIDLIITTDDAALKFAIEHRKELFSDAPIVFGGVIKDSAEKLLDGVEDVVGVYEAMDPEGTLKIALEIIPDVTDIYIIHDNTESGLATGKIISDAISTIDNHIIQHELKYFSFDQIQEKLAGLGQGSIAILDAYSTDSTGLTLPISQFMDMLVATSNVPIFSMEEATFGEGSVGGSILSSEIHGSMIAGLSMRVLEGEDINTFSNIDKKSVFYGFDYQMLEKFHISEDKLPKDSLIINKPFSLINTYKVQAIIILLLLLFLIIFLGYLSFNVRIRKKAEITLMGNNEELTAIYEEIAASEETIKQNFEELMENQKELQRSKEKYRLVAESSMDIIWETDLLNNKRIFSDKLEDMLGYTNKELERMEDWMQLIHPDDYIRMQNKIQYELINTIMVAPSSEYRVKCKNGNYKWIQSNVKGQKDESGKFVKIYGSYTDITELKVHQMEINKLAYFDAITELPNRVMLQEKIQSHINQDLYGNQFFALIFIDLDNFKIINDSYGHLIGDKLLLSVAERLKEFQDQRCSAFRLGGDEFIILLTNLNSRSEVEVYAEKILQSISSRYMIDYHTFHISASMGIVFYPEDGINFKELLKNADTAMYWSKDIGKSTFSYYTMSMGNAAVDKIEIQNNLYLAIENKEFVLYYQPLIEVENGDLKGFEALIRWIHPIKGLIPPDKFIGVAEETGMIIEIGTWVMESACKYAKQLIAHGLRDFHISVNVSAIQLLQRNFTKVLATILEETDLNPRYIMIEITESVMMESFELVIKTLLEVENMGIRIALDDFGCGYSSLTYLRQLPIDTLKIDKSFVSDIVAVEDDNCMTGSIITLAKQLGLNVIAEGVEENKQLDYLKMHMCDFFQGYLVSRPIPEKEVLPFLKSREFK